MVYQTCSFPVGGQGEGRRRGRGTEGVEEEQEESRRIRRRRRRKVTGMSFGRHSWEQAAAAGRQHQSIINQWIKTDFSM